jgi:hypothetical protein
MPNRYLLKIAGLVSDFIGSEAGSSNMDRAIGTAGLVVPSLLLGHNMAKEKLDDGEQLDAGKIAKTNAEAGAVEGGLLALKDRHMGSLGPRTLAYGSMMGALDGGASYIEAKRMAHSKNRSD